MAERFCLRCDWAGETEEPACPRCGAPLYRMGRSEPTPAPPEVPPARHDPPAEVQGTRGAPLEGSEGEGDRDEARLPSVATAERGRWRVIALALTLTAVVAFALTRGGETDPGGRDQARADAETPADPAVPSLPTDPSPAHHLRAPAMPRRRPHPSPPRPCRPRHGRLLLPGLARKQPGNRPRPGRGREGQQRVHGRWKDRGHGAPLRRRQRVGAGSDDPRHPALGILDRDPVPLRSPRRVPQGHRLQERLDRRWLVPAGRMPDLLPEGAGRPHQDRLGLLRAGRPHARCRPTGSSGTSTASGSSRSTTAVASRRSADRTASGSSSTTSRRPREWSSGAVSQIRLFDQALTANEVALLACTELAIADPTFPCHGLER